MGKIIQIRGTNGSGKSAIIKDLLNRFEFQKLDDACYLPDKNLFVIGRYFGRNGLIPTGGCDQLKINRVVELIRKYKFANILFEGAKESRTYRRWLNYPEIEMIFLATPLETCLKWRDQRREGRNIPYDNHTLIEGYHRVEKLKYRFIDNLMKVYTVNPENCLPLIFRLLGEKRNNLKDLRNLSGSGKRTHTVRGALYTTHPLFPEEPGTRNTEKRFEEFGIDKLSGSVLDIGSNVGALTYTALERGGSFVIGFEFSWERVEFCNRFANKNCRFVQVDLRKHLPNVVADIVFCCSVDEYIKDKQNFYNYLRRTTENTLYFECNVQRNQTVEQTTKMLNTAGFQVEYLGSGDDGGISRKRRIFKCK